MLKRLVSGCKNMTEKYKQSIESQKDDIVSLEQSIVRKKESLNNFIDEELYGIEQNKGKLQLEYDNAVAKLSDELNANMRILKDNEVVLLAAKADMLTK